VILGTYDTLVPVIVGEQIFGLNSNIQINIIDKAGHVPFLSHPEQLLLLLRAFLEDANAD
jgi:pimeloyl-[acyl-carrier protein] methyl ester esterase